MLKKVLTLCLLSTATAFAAPNSKDVMKSGKALPASSKEHCLKVGTDAPNIQLQDIKGKQ